LEKEKDGTEKFLFLKFEKNAIKRYPILDVIFTSLVFNFLKH